MANKKQKTKINTLAIILSIVSASMMIVAVIFLVLFINARSEIDCLENDIKELREEYGVDYDDDFGDDGDDDFDPHMYVVKKPMIYLYPTEETNVLVKVGNPDKLKTVYPKYDDGWRVTARPDGSLTDLKTGRSLYGLYWEGENYPAKRSDDGFVVAGKDSAKFLEEKLATLGLTEREANEMIIYWLPQLEASAYNYIRFDLNETMDEYMPLNISPKPDAIIRVSMVFKGLEKPISVREQKLTTSERNGFTVVEWGGSEIH